MSDLTVAYVTAGGAGMYCGSCMRDNSLVAAVRQLGCDAVLLPTFTPIRTDMADVSEERVFLGGINVYLEQRWPMMRRLPGPLRRALDHPRLLRWISSLALQTRGADDGALAASLLRGEHGHQRAEIDDLVRFLVDDLKPDVVNLTNLLIAGFVPALKRARDIPTLVTLQGDDVFLDSLPTAQRELVLPEMRRVAQTIDGFVVFSCYYRDFMAELFDIPTSRFHIVPLGLDAPQQFARRGPKSSEAPPTLGYLARICPEKGFHQLVEAYLELRQLPGMGQVRLRAAGWLGRGDRAFFDKQVARIADAGAASHFEHVELADRENKIDFLHSLDVLSVPTVYREPKGIFALEALAAGVPVVLPDHGAFPELLAATGGGRLVAPGDTTDLADTLRELLSDDTARRRLGEQGQAGVLATSSGEIMAQRTLEVWSRFV